MGSRWQRPDVTPVSVRQRRPSRGSADREPAATLARSWRPRWDSIASDDPSGQASARLLHVAWTARNRCSEELWRTTREPRMPSIDRKHETARPIDETGNMR